MLQHVNIIIENIKNKIDKCQIILKWIRKINYFNLVTADDAGRIEEFGIPTPRRAELAESNA